MAEHIPKPEIERFSVSALPEEQQVTIAEHLAECEACHRVLSETLRSQRGTEGLKFTLAPEFWFRHDHLDYEQLVAIAENKLDAAEREIIDIHLSTCATCPEDVSSFLAFRDQIEPELRIHYGPAAKQVKPSAVSIWNWRRARPWRPAYIAAIILIVVGLMIALLYVRRTTRNLEVRQTPPPQINTPGIGTTPTPENQVVRDLQPSPAPTQSAQSPQPTSSPPLSVKNREPVKQPENASVVVALNDGRGKVTVDKTGVLSGLDDVPAATRREVAKALIAEKIETPEIVKELSGPERTLRGGSSSQPFKLLSPARIVIISDRPSFQWEKLPGATSYRVYVGDTKGHEVAKSEALSLTSSTWTPPVALKRGEIYSWAVAAIVNSKEIFSPGPSAPEMKFEILSSHSLQELRQLKKTNSHLALGVFYAKLGMITEAGRAFQVLVRLNPKSRAASNLLRSVRLPR